MTLKNKITKLNNLCPALGILAVLLTVLPYFLLGKDAIYTYLDQLDGEMIAYILQAKHLFHGNVLPEFMNGASKTALIPPAPLAVLLFLPGNYNVALVLMTLLGKLWGYVGMYLLVREVTDEKWIAALSAFLYSCIPFLAVYGLGEFGIPMLFWCALQVKKGKHLTAAYLYTALYALSSSLVLVGFGVLGFGLVWILYTMVSDRQKRKANKKVPPDAPAKFALQTRLTLFWLLLLAVYFAENISLFSQLLGTEKDFVTHKSEYILSAQPFLEVFLNGLLSGTQHGNGYHALLLVCILVAVIAGCIRMLSSKKDMSVKPLLTVMFFCLGWNVCFALLSALWDSAPGIALRSRLSFLGTFHLDRLLWMAPCLWYLAAACGLTLIYRLYRNSFRYLFCLLPMTVLFGATALWSLYSGEFKMNVQKLKDPDYGILSYRDYYAIGVMEQVRAFLDTYTGKSVEEYRVVSLGIDPAVALYHGFYCLDGYSNNYSLEYKKRFREIIAPELEKSAYLTQYYDGWGNRCYLFSAECPGYYTIEKHGFYFQNYQIDTDALYEMGGRYLLSAAWIQNAEAQGLTLLNETPFETDDSYYYIYVYEISPYIPLPQKTPPQLPDQNVCRILPG
ncbi:MAG: DUF6044 family protein [Firmicutes bacterium]|nr:DUF6044 family protein [Bacillota bacterium]